MSHPRPSLYQCLVLHEVADGRVFRRDGDWYVVGSYRDHKITQQVNKLVELKALSFEVDRLGEQAYLCVTDAGKVVMDRRPLSELLEQINSKPGRRT